MDIGSETVGFEYKWRKLFVFMSIGAAADSRQLRKLLKFPLKNRPPI